MKKYYMKEVKQNGREFYTLVADPKVIVKIVPYIDPDKVQEIQRPWKEKKVKQVATYVSGRFVYDENKKATGLIPTVPVLNVKSKIELQKDSNGFYIELPETKEEFKEYSGAIEILDGQHRIRAFMDGYISPDFSTRTQYEMVFNIFFKLSKKEKQEIFMITNDMQTKVPLNLLRLYKRDLDLLKDDTEIFDLVTILNEEDFSPLKGRIIIGANPDIKKGYQESQISKILNKSGLYIELKAKLLDNNVIAKMISNYIEAWEQVYNVSYKDPQNETITKISGLRYILFLFPTFIDILTKREKAATKDAFVDMIRMIPDAIEVDDVFTDESTKPSFYGEGATVTMVKAHILKIKAYEQNNISKFDISAGI